MFATERSRQNLRLAGALLLVVAGRIYLSSGGEDAMRFTAPHLHQFDDALKLLAFVALGVAISATVAVAGKRWVGRLACVGLGGVAGLLAISQYNAILGAAIGLVVGLLVACGAFLAVLFALARVAVATAFGVICGAAALGTQQDLNAGPGAVVLLLMTATVVAAAFVLFRRSRQQSPVEWQRRWLRRLGRTNLCLLVIVGLWISLSVDAVRRVNRIGIQGNLSPLIPELPWLWRGCIKTTWLDARRDLQDEDLVCLRNFTDLEFLNLSNTRITDAGLAELRNLPRLRYLLLNSTKINGKGFEHLATLPALAELALDDTPISDENFASLQKLAGLRRLWLKNTPIGNAALAPIGKLGTLGALILSGTKITDAGLIQLQGLASLGHLDLSNTQIQGTGLPNLAPLLWLQHLDLSQTQITDADLEKLPTLPKLSRLRLDGTQITDAGLAHLKKQPILCIVDAYETAVTAEGAEDFCKAMRRRATMPLCSVNR